MNSSFLSQRHTEAMDGCGLDFVEKADAGIGFSGKGGFPVVA